MKKAGSSYEKRQRWIFCFFITVHPVLFDGGAPSMDDKKFIYEQSRDYVNAYEVDSGRIEF